MQQIVFPAALLTGIFVQRHRIRLPHARNAIYMDTFDAINQRRSTLTDLLDPLGDCMTPEVAKKVVQLRASADANSRMQLLAGKSAAGTLTDEEREEYEACVSAGTFIAILQAKARRMLGQNGAA